uniref:NADH dehydrogenase subunit 6 n=1 Tax=Anaxandra taurina TaxID=2575663 RepID=A0A4D6X7P9_9HEMI|nr:NADH dehydrogenase subunit 6 [Anaxandra taurina]QCI09245.1 NADH dehydrogenase subunit 6 [Anaxandra taurina]
MMWLMTFMTSMAILIMFLNHPLSMGLLLILQTIIVALSTGMIAGYFLMSYIITIIMLSGALVLFIYMASVASNEMFYTPIKLMGVFFMMNLIIPFMLDKNENPENEMINNNSLNMETITTMKLFSQPSAYITIIMIMYLLFTMIVVSNNVNINKGPLRIKMYE